MRPGSAGAHPYVCGWSGQGERRSGNETAQKQ